MLKEKAFLEGMRRLGHALGVAAGLVIMAMLWIINGGVPGDQVAVSLFATLVYFLVIWGVTYLFFRFGSQAYVWTLRGFKGEAREEKTEE